MMRLHGYWRSSAAYRVRIALNLKGISYAQATHDLRTGAQRAADYRAIAPQGLVPALETEEGVLTQSPAILEWIDERWPTPPLLPADAYGRARVRAMAALIGCDIHPLNNLRVLRHLREEFDATQAQIDGWIARWITDGFTALETLAARHGGAFCHGDEPGLADCYVVPQLYSAERFGVDLAPFPTLQRIGQAMAMIEAVAQAHPSRQPDADPV